MGRAVRYLMVGDRSKAQIRRVDGFLGIRCSGLKERERKSDCNCLMRSRNVEKTNLPYRNRLVGGAERVHVRRQALR